MISPLIVFAKKNLSTDAFAFKGGHNEMKLGFPRILVTRFEVCFMQHLRWLCDKYPVFLLV